MLSLLTIPVHYLTAGLAPATTGESI